ncbi:hypothetical protein PRIEUP_LOCUS568, partial [Pristimantis euphronides]
MHRCLLPAWEGPGCAAARALEAANVLYETRARGPERSARWPLPERSADYSPYLAEPCGELLCELGAAHYPEPKSEAHLPVPPAALREQRQPEQQRLLLQPPGPGARRPRQPHKKPLDKHSTEYKQRREREQPGRAQEPRQGEGAAPGDAAQGAGAGHGERAAAAQGGGASRELCTLQTFTRSCRPRPRGP